jgi:hypothetical protein
VAPLNSIKTLDRSELDKAYRMSAYMYVLWLESLLFLWYYSTFLNYKLIYNPCNHSRLHESKIIPGQTERSFSVRKYKRKSNSYVWDSGQKHPFLWPVYINFWKTEFLLNDMRELIFCLPGNTCILRLHCQTQSINV